MTTLICSVAECGASTYNKKQTLCVKHLRRYERYGSTDLPFKEVRLLVCSVENCERRIYSNKVCSMHYARMKKHGSYTAPNGKEPEKSKEIATRECTVSKCHRAAKYKKYCSLHYRRVSQHGSIELPDKEKICSVDACESSALRLGMCPLHYKRARLGKELTSRKCLVCQTDFEYNSKKRTTCSAECQKRLVRAHVDKRRAQIRIGAKSLAINLSREKVFERDSFICQLCQEPLNMSVKYYSHKKCEICETVCFKSASLDHIVPLSKGGLHVYENVQAAHLGCNMQKGASLKEEKKSNAYSL